MRTSHSDRVRAPHLKRHVVYVVCVQAGIIDGCCVEMEQGRLSSRDVPFGPGEGAALELHQKSFKDELMACTAWQCRRQHASRQA